MRWILFAAGLVVAACEPTAAPVIPVATRAPIAVVPWSAATPTPTPAPTPPAPPPGLARCSPSQLIARFDGWNTPSRPWEEHSLSTLVSLAVRGPERCWVRTDPPAVRLLDSGGSPLPLTVVHTPAAPGSGPIFYGFAVLDPSHDLGPPTGYNASDAWFTVWWRNWCGGPASLKTLAVTLASGEELRVPIPGMTGIDGGAREPPTCVNSSAPSTLQVGNIDSSSATTPAAPVPHVVFEVDIDRPLTAVAGGTLRYGIVLTNASSSPVHFSSCPSYEQVIYTISRAGLLNCAGVDVIAPDERVVFEMELSIPADAQIGRDALVWSLRGDGGYFGTGKFLVSITSP